MDTISFYYLIGGVVILHFLVGIFYLMYKVNQKPKAPKEDDKTSKKTFKEKTYVK